MNRCVGVSTPSSRPNRTTAPLKNGSSSRRPRSRSSSIDDLAPGGSAACAATILSILSSGSAMPRARATANDSRSASAIIAARSGSLTITPMGQRAAAVMPLKTLNCANFNQISTMIWSLSTLSNPAPRHACEQGFQLRDGVRSADARRRSRRVGPAGAAAGVRRATEDETAHGRVPDHARLRDDGRDVAGAAGDVLRAQPPGSARQRFRRRSGRE